MNILIYYIVFIIIYASKIERLTIDKKKGVIKLAYINCFLSKEEKGKLLSDFLDMEILHKGYINRGYDSTQFYIRITFKDQTTFVFGETVSFMRIEMKYRQCAAIIKGIVIPDIIDAGFITDEVIDETKDN